MTMRNLYEIFNIKRLSDEDVERLIWWTRGIREGIDGFGTYSIFNKPLEVEYEDGFELGRETVRSNKIARMKPK